MLVLGIETSCDETSLALVEDGRKVLGVFTHTQIPDHQQYGGVIPELASRKHIEFFLPVLDHLFQQTKTTLSDVDLIAVAIGPGLLGSLLVGINAAKSLSYLTSKPIIGVDHVLAHLYAPWLFDTQKEKPAEPMFPLLALTVSGGHSSVVLQKSHTERTLLGSTRDDAAGEAFDKVAVLLGLSYPGGPLIAKLAETGDPKAIDFPRAIPERTTYDYSFSGLKTAVSRAVATEQWKKEDVAASFQEAVVDALLHKLKLAYENEQPSSVLITGGVSANKRLREKASALFGDQCIFPPFTYCTDNGAMIAGAGFFQYQTGSFSGKYEDIHVALQSTL